MQLERYIQRLPWLFKEFQDLESQLTIIANSGVVKYTVENYAELLTVVDQSVDNLAYVRSSQGTSWLPGSLGGTYYGKGLYIWTGSAWGEANIEINTALDQLFDEHQIEFITSNYLLPSSATFAGEITIKNVSINTLEVNTEVADKLEGEDTQLIYEGESFTIKKYALNDYRIV